MNDLIRPSAPTLDVLQIAWLQEIGIDKRMLARYAAHGGRAVAAPESPTAPVVAPAPVAAADRPVSALQPQPSSSKSIQAKPVAAPRMPAAPPRIADAQSVPPENPLANIPVPHAWEALQDHIAVCQACGLQSGRSQTVFGTGAINSPDWLLVGEAPGGQDDRVGLPFQGRPGVLLEAMLASIGVQGSTVFFTNLIKCRPLGNRTPKPEEIAACLPYLRRQITLLKPRRIVALGKLAAQGLLGTDSDFETLRGRVHHIQSESGQAIPLVVTYHPAALLLRPQHKADAWQDLNLARAIVLDDAASEGRPAH